MELLFNLVKQRYLKEYIDAFMTFKIYSYFEIYINKHHKPEQTKTHYTMAPLPLQKNQFNTIIRNIYLDMNPDLDEEDIYWFYINTYINDINPLKKEEIINHYEEYKEILHNKKVLKAVYSYYIKAEAFRYVIKFLENRNITLIEIETKIKEIDNNTNRNLLFYTFTETIKMLLKNIISEYKINNKNQIKPNVNNFKIEDRLDKIKNNIVSRHFDNNLFNKDITLIKNNKVTNKNFNDLLNKISHNIYHLDSFLKKNYQLNHEEYLNKFEKGLEGGLVLVNQIYVLKNKYCDKKSRVKDFLLNKQTITLDLELLVALEHIVDNNSHPMLIVMAVISHELTLTNKESFELLQLLDFYNNESYNWKKGKFHQKFQTIKEHIYYNYKLLNNKISI